VHFELSDSHQLTDPEYFARREVALTKKDREHGEDIYIRFKSYADADSFKRDLIAKDDQPPHKIDFGAVYNVSVSNIEISLCEVDTIILPDVMCIA